MKAPFLLHSLRIMLSFQDLMTYSLAGEKTRY